MISLRGAMRNATHFAPKVAIASFVANQVRFPCEPRRVVKWRKKEDGDK